MTRSVTLTSIASLALASALAAQRQHVVNPVFGQTDPNGAINGDMPPDTSNWPHPAAPDGNPFARSTDPIAVQRYSANKAQLGALLFWEEQMSSDNTMSCGTCHIPANGGIDPRPGPLPGGLGGSFGMIRQHEAAPNQIDYNFAAAPSTDINRQATGLNPPTMIGAHAFNILFWLGTDGPTFDDLTTGLPFPNFADWAGLEDQADNPEVSPVEMGHENINWLSGFIQTKLDNSLPLALVDPATIPAAMMPFYSSGAHYRDLFDKVYQFDPDPMIGGIQGVTRERIAMALAHYMRTLIPDRAPMDTGLTPQQVAGFNIMNGAGCFGCHSATGAPALTGGVLNNPFDNSFSDGDLHNIGTGGFRKTPTLRNVGLRPRFFSNGSIVGLNNLLDFYNNRAQPLGFGGGIPPGSLARAAVFDFLFNGLTDPRVAAETGPFARPELCSERPAFNPFEGNEYGNATPGPSGLLAEIIANCPPLVLKPLGPTPTPVIDWFKVGVGNAPPGRPAFLLWANIIGGGPVLWVDPATFTAISVGNTDGQGIATAHVPFPLTAATIGAPFFTQWLIDDAGVRSFSDAAQFTPFQF